MTPEELTNKLKEGCYCHAHYRCHRCYIADYSEELIDLIKPLDKQTAKEAILYVFDYVDHIWIDKDREKYEKVRLLHFEICQDKKRILLEKLGLGE